MQNKEKKNHAVYLCNKYTFLHVHVLQECTELGVLFPYTVRWLQILEGSQPSKLKIFLQTCKNELKSKFTFSNIPPSKNLMQFDIFWIVHTSAPPVAHAAVGGLSTKAAGPLMYLCPAFCRMGGTLQFCNPQWLLKLRMCTVSSRS